MAADFVGLAVVAIVSGTRWSRRSAGCSPS